MKVVSFTVGELPDVLGMDYFQGTGEVPISPLRAQAHFHNPRAEKSDRVLWCLLSEGQLLAYRLLLPSTLSDGKKRVKMAWNSCLWVDPSHRGKGYGKKLSRLAMEEWDNKLMFVNSVSASVALYSRIENCREVYRNIGIRYYFTSELARLIPLKKPVLAPFSFLLKPIDFLLNTVARLKNNTSHTNEGIYKIIENLSADDISFITSSDQDNLPKIGAAELSWMEAHPWVIESGDPNPYADRYHFSIQYPVFKNYFIKLEESGETTAIVLLKNKESHFAVHYVWANPEALQGVAKSILSVIANRHPKTLSIYHDGLRQAMATLNVGYLFKKDTEQKFMAFSGIPMLEHSGRDCFQYGDGDTVFT